MHDFDRPLFKKLRRNDTSAGSNQAGPYIPKALDKYFPQLSTATITAENPTVGIPIKAVLFVGSTEVGLVTTRYQYQTWGAERTIERRITGHLGPLMKQAKAGDFIVIERSISDPDFYRLTLHKSGTEEFNNLEKRAAKLPPKRPWGPVNEGDVPVAETEIVNAEAQQKARESTPFALFDNAAALIESRTYRIARSKAFARRLLPLYGFRCVVCGKAHGDGDLSEVEAAHIVPRSRKGVDDARNGLALCRSHHWAFDRGLFGVDPDGKIEIRPEAIADPRNAHLLPFDTQPIAGPADPDLRPAPGALAWHLKEIVYFKPAP